MSDGRQRLSFVKPHDLLLQSSHFIRTTVEPHSPFLITPPIIRNSCGRLPNNTDLDNRHRGHGLAVPRTVRPGQILCVVQPRPKGPSAPKHADSTKGVSVRCRCQNKTLDGNIMRIGCHHKTNNPLEMSEDRWVVHEWRLPHAVLRRRHYVSP